MINAWVDAKKLTANIVSKASIHALHATKRDTAPVLARILKLKRNTFCNVLNQVQNCRMVIIRFTVVMPEFYSAKVFRKRVLENKPLFCKKL